MIYFHLEVKMENQINIDNQNNQQVGQSPIDQSAAVQEKPKVSYWAILSVVFVILLLGLVSVYVWNFKTIQKPTTTPQPSPIPQTPRGETNCETLKTYTNPRLELSLQLPSCFEVYEPNPDYGASSWIYIDDPRLDEYFKNIFSVSSEGNSIPGKERASFEEVTRSSRDYYLYSTSSGWVEDEPYVSEENQVSFDGKTGIKYTIKFKKKSDVVYWTYIPWNEFYIRKVEYSTHVEKAEQILKSITYLNPEMVQVMVYFDNVNKNPGKTQCDSVYPVSRMIPKYYNTVDLTLNELFKGPTAKEQTDGYRSIFSDKTKNLLNGVIADDSQGKDKRVVYLDFKPEAFAKAEKAGATTSCGGGEFVASIERTLKQFPEYEKYMDIQKSTVGGNRQAYCDYMQMSQEDCQR